MLIAVPLLATTATAPAAAANCQTSPLQGILNSLFGGPAPLGLPVRACTIPVYPGAMVTVEGSHGGFGGMCTLNFVFDGSDGHRYVGTAGHCTLASNPFGASPGEFTYPTGTGPVVSLGGTGTRIGEIVWAVQETPHDMALIRLDPGVSTDPDLPHWGPVTGINTQTTSASTTVRWVGHGVGIGSLLYARTGVALSTLNPDRMYVTGLVVPGDSGGPVVDNTGRAVGVNTALTVSVGSLDSTGIQIVTRLAPQLARATTATGVTYTLA